MAGVKVLSDFECGDENEDTVAGINDTKVESGHPCAHNCWMAARWHDEAEGELGHLDNEDAHRNNSWNRHIHGLLKSTGVLVSIHHWRYCHRNLRVGRV